MIRTTSLLLALALVSAPVSAHKDRILTIGPDGAIPEIPASLGPVSLKISGLGTPTPSVQFRAGSHLNELPDCATRLIKTESSKEVLVKGSWYHAESTLPYYVDVQFYEPGFVASRSYNSSFNILFNLRTAAVIKIERFVADKSGNGGQYVPVTLPRGCTLQPHAP